MANIFFVGRHFLHSRSRSISPSHDRSLDLRVIKVPALIASVCRVRVCGVAVCVVLLCVCECVDVCVCVRNDSNSIIVNVPASTMTLLIGLANSALIIKCVVEVQLKRA